MRTVLLLLATTLLAACPTRFEGSAYFPGGAQACAERCASLPGLEMGSFIYAGEFSTACVCRVKSAPAEAAETAAAVGVITQVRAAAAQQGTRAAGAR